MFIGSLFLIPLLVTIYKTQKDKSLLYFLPTVFFLFQPQYWPNTYWAMASLQNLGVLLFSFLCLYLLNKPEHKYFYFSLFLLVLSVFTSANGLLLIFIGSLPLTTGKQFKKLFIWLMLGICLSCFYFYHYQPFTHIFPLHPSTIVQYFLFFLGSAFQKSIPLIIGMLFCAYFLYLTKIGYYKKHPTLYFFLLFLFGSALMASLGRSMWGVFHSLGARYKIYSALFLVIFYLVTMERLPKKVIRVFFPAVLTISIIFNLLSYRQNIPQILEHRQKILTQYFSPR